MFKMIALASLAGSAALLAAPSVQAETIEIAPERDLSGFYVNTEAESGWRGSDYYGTQIDVRAGYEHELGEDALVYVEAGPAFLLPDGADQDTELGVEVGGSVGVTDHVELYGSFEIITGEDNDYTSTVGATYRF